MYQSYISKFIHSLLLITGLSLHHYTHTCHISSMAGSIPNEVCEITYFLMSLQKKVPHKHPIPGKSFIFYGKAGSGKTKCIEYIEKESGAIVIIYDYPKELRTKGSGEIRRIFERAEALSKQQNKPVVLVFENIDQSPDNGGVLHNPIQDYRNKLVTIVTAHTMEDVSEGLHSRCDAIKFKNPHVLNRKKIIKHYCDKYQATLPSWFVIALSVSSFGKTGGDIEKALKRTDQEIKNGIPLSKTRVFKDLCWENSKTVGKIGATTTISIASLILVLYGIRHGIKITKPEITQGTTGKQSSNSSTSISSNSSNEG